MSRIEIIPAIDIIEGRCVRLSQGDYDRKKIYDASPLDMAKKYADCGVKRLHIVDLDGAKASKPMNLKVLEAVSAVKGLEIEWGGGIKSDVALNDVFNAGASFAVVGSVASRQPDLFQKWLEQYGGDRMVLGADVSNGKIAVNGWLETDEIGIEDLTERFLPYGLERCIVTEISRDGMLQGPATELYVDLQKRFPDINFTVSGGVSSIDDIIKLDEAGLKSVIVGKAIYENRIPLKFIEEWLQNE
ncbi:MAG: 1-(5-phosphoribosyl)-5-[(5-phosphoribosylamino)methylideneamino]imidazole-4-carboxamide isomerase [Muribaculaceae bacterium]|nr:1-(5-phosphoribosyl)-5-[(5-phosphoribosylamino)methylideneamino]imidazole-4-carboxamide isomerase [Muribaculaceae bacterium]MDE7369514.1 1-(5-phosphoribosyl)-5-[(5-phosphoribosylamino)methylideneamino]imidazole-4-carboxamide isomerase [Muribaculaceae bacterium]